MTVPEKELFIIGLLDNMKSEITGEAEKFPEYWDGYEIRAYIARTANDYALTMQEPRAKRFIGDCERLRLSH